MLRDGHFEKARRSAEAAQGQSGGWEGEEEKESWGHDK